MIVELIEIIFAVLRVSETVNVMTNLESKLRDIDYHKLFQHQHFF